MRIQIRIKCRQFLILMFILLPFWSASAQFVRKDSFPTEHSRRQRYALDDWISYTKARRFTSVTISPDYIYFGTQDGGILRYRLFQNRWDYPFTVSNGLPSNRVLNVVYDDDNGLLWAVTDVDTAVFNFAAEEWFPKSETPGWSYKFPPPPAPQKREKIQKNIFYGRRFLNLLPPFFMNGPYTLTGDFKILDRFFRTFPITGFMKDRWQRIWFLIDGLGVGVGDLFARRIDVIEYGLSAIVPRAIAFQKNDLWIGGFRNGPERPGIVRFVDRENRWKYYEARWISHLPDDKVTSIAVDGDSVWFGTHYGVSLFDTDRNRWKNFSQGKGMVSNEITDVVSYGDFIFASSDQGISWINKVTGLVRTVKDDRFRILPVNRLAVQGDTLWAGSDRGLFRYIPQKGAWQFVPSRAAIQDLDITAMASFKNEMWFASNGGIMKLNVATGQWESFPQIGVELGGSFSDIKVNAKSVWAATSRGLLKYDRKREYWRLFTNEDGLLDNHCHRLLLDGDFIWVTTDKGVTQFFWDNPDRID